MRAQAKAFVASQDRPPMPRMDPNNFTCKFCLGTFDKVMNKFVHTETCSLHAPVTMTQMEQTAQAIATKK